MTDTTTQIIRAADDLSLTLAATPGLPIAPAVVGADPTVYCGDYYRAYLARAASGPRRCLIVGMNPGPHGMAQTGVPFGDAPNAKRILASWLAANPDAPKPYFGIFLPARPTDLFASGTPTLPQPLLKIVGLEYHRGEESGRRLWSVLEQVCGSLDAALERALVINYCPLVFLDSEGRNVTPAAWPARAPARQAMERVCDAWLQSVVRAVQPRTIVAVGGYVADALDRLPSFKGEIVRMRHPSPLAGSAQSFASAAIPILAQACGVDP